MSEHTHILTFGELTWDALLSSQKTCRITNDNNAIEDWTFEKGGTCHTRVTHFGPQFTFHRKSSYILNGMPRNLFQGWRGWDFEHLHQP
nr:hypothetical protein GZ31B6_38 [uncultured archaeon GZfos31B6]